MNPTNAIRHYIAQSLVALRRVRRCSLRSRAILLMLVALLNTLQGIACNLHDVSLATRANEKISHVWRAGTEFRLESVVDVARDHSHDPSTPLDIEAHCLHISCVHSPAFPPSAITHEFVLALSAVPTSGARLHWPAPPLGVHFRPPIAA